MATPQPLDETQPPPSKPAQPRQMLAHPWADESGWEDVAHQRQAGATGGGIRRKEVPAVLKPGGGFVASEEEEENVWNEARNQPSGSTRLDEVPDVLKPDLKRSETNPFSRKKVPNIPNTDLPPVLVQPPAESFSKLDLDEPSNHNPWAPAADVQSAPVDKQPLTVVPGDGDSDPWTRSTPERPPKESLATNSPALLSLHSEGLGWDDDSRSDLGNTTVSMQTAAMPDELLREQHVWDDLGAPETAKGKSRAPGLSAGRTAHLDDWSVIDSDRSSPPSKQPQAEPSAEKPPLPPRLVGERARWIPSRSPVDGKNETYQVKNIQWHDTSSAMNPRVSPILIQNENGPCPLVALVNALTLTTPADIDDTALVQVLRSREQVSLSLLLDAVLDELMSSRRTTSEDSLPDVGDLYTFLQSLHTGMNVNPRFLPTPEMVTAYKRTSLTHLPPSDRGELIPGTFENTMEMALYATFSIPLIHGWLPPQDDPACASMERHAASYEDVQNLLFREEELEDKLSNPEAGLSESEQELYQDIITIRIFLNEWATQLTPWGIEVIGKAIRPGTFAILFRNDHFSTLYCHPQTGQLLTLVTDAGYKSHDEVVWESLIDVNGEQNEFLSGDFRATSGGGADAAAATSTEPSRTGGHAGDQGGGSWTAVTDKRGKTREKLEELPMSPSTEQEDRDLALALQLQEEEDQRDREEQARRQRERILSEQYIEQQAHRPTPVNPTTTPSGDGLIPQRQSTNSVHVRGTANPRPQGPGRQPVPAQQHIRPLVPPRRQGVTRPADSGDDAPPPTYEQAAQVPAYVPPLGHPTHPSSSPTSASRASRSSASAGGSASTSAGAGAGSPAARVQPPGGRRPPMGTGSLTGSQHRGDRDCVAM